MNANTILLCLLCSRFCQKRNLFSIFGSFYNERLGRHFTLVVVVYDNIIPSIAWILPVWSDRKNREKEGAAAATTANDNEWSRSRHEYGRTKQFIINEWMNEWNCYKVIGRPFWWHGSRQPKTELNNQPKQIANWTRPTVHGELASGDPLFEFDTCTFTYTIQYYAN